MIESEYKLKTPNKLYGREGDLKILLESADNAWNGSKEICWITGLSGTGKSSLVSNFKSTITKRGGWFVEGKYGQFEQDNPYSGLVEIMKQLIHVLLSGSENNNFYITRLVELMEGNGGLLTLLVPQLEILIGKQTEPEDLSPVESKNRFNLTLLNFFSVFANKERPLVIFLDDLQWSDLSSLQFLNHLLNDSGLSHLLFIGAYRNNEVEANHPLSQFIVQLDSQQILSKNIHLTELDKESIRCFVSDTLKQPPEDVLELTNDLIDVTEGNPFFVHQFLSCMYDEGLINYNETDNYWDFNMNSIRSARFPEDANQLLFRRIKSCPLSCQEMLSVSSIVGSSFNSDVLAEVLEIPERNVENTLQPAIENGLIKVQKEEEKPIFSFAHDSIRQASYDNIDSKYRQNLHFRIGEVFKRKWVEKNDAVSVFDVVNQFNNVSNYIENKEELKNLVGLNEQAGDKAWKSNAYRVALNYYLNAIKLQGEGGWLHSYEQHFRLHKIAGDCAYLNTDFVQAEKVFEIAQKNVKTNLHKAQIYASCVIMYNNQGKLDKAWKTGLMALSLLGAKFSPKPSKLAVLWQIWKVHRLIGNRSIKDLLEREDMQDEHAQLALTIMMQLLTSAFNQSPELLAMCVLRAFELALKFGNSPTAYFGYAGYGAIIGLGFGKVKKGWDFIEASHSLTQKYSSTFYYGRGYFSKGGNYIHLVHPMQEAVESLDKSYHLGIAAGDFTNVGYVGISKMEFLWAAGYEINLIVDSVRKCRAFANKIKFHDVACFMSSIEFCAQLLKGCDDSTSNSLQEKFITHLNSTSFTHIRVAYRIFYIQVLYLLGKHESALNNIKDIEKEAHTLPPTVVEGTYYFYRTLLLCSSPEITAKNKRKIREGIKNIEKFATTAPFNYSHQLHLLRAEYASIRNEESAELDYQEAIKLAEKSSFTQISALANERFALHWIKKGKKEKSKAYLNGSIALYEKWGAIKKAQQLRALLN